MRRVLLGKTPVLLLSLLISVAAHAQRPGSELCRTAIAATERATGVPDRLMQAIGIMESGRSDPSGITAAWPWTINVEGVGEVYDSKADVIAAVRRHQAGGARSIDVGCMQVNLLHHASAFASLEEAFDPVANARYAAHFLQQLLGQTGSWPRAVAGYHSLTPDIGGEYARKVLAIWARPEQAPKMATPVSLSPATAPTPAPASGPTPSLPGASMAGLAPPLPATAAGTGRGLDFYRSLPIRMAAAAGLRRF